MNKIIAREVEPESRDFRDYFDDDEGLTNKGGENCALYIIETEYRGISGFNIDEYKSIQNEAESIIDGFNDVSNKWTNGYNSYATYKEAMEDNGVKYTSRKCHLLKEWAKTAEISETDSIAEYLTITTSAEWKTKSFCGYSQGDYCEVVYCPEHYTNGVEEYGKMWLGCGTEFIIDDCGGYYVVDSIRWTEDERLVKYLAEMFGCDPEELEVQLYTGDHRVADYKTLTA